MTNKNQVVCLKSVAPLESTVKPISLSVGVKGKVSASSHPWFLVTGIDTQQLCYLLSCYPTPKSEKPCCVYGVPGAVYEVHSETSNKVHQQRSTLTRKSIESLLFDQSLLYIQDCSPSATFLTTMANQIFLMPGP